MGVSGRRGHAFKASDLLQLLLEGRSVKGVERKCGEHADPPMQFLQRAKDLLDDAGIDVSGPLPAPMPRRAGYLRAQLVLASPERRRLHAALEALVPRLHALPEARKLRWSLDVDPIELF